MACIAFGVTFLITSTIDISFDVFVITFVVVITFDVFIIFTVAITFDGMHYIWCWNTRLLTIWVLRTGPLMVENTSLIFWRDTRLFLTSLHPYYTHGLTTSNRTFRIKWYFEMKTYCYFNLTRGTTINQIFLKIVICYQNISNIFQPISSTADVYGLTKSIWLSGLSWMQTNKNILKANQYFERYSD